MTSFPEFSLSLPAWMVGELPDSSQVFNTAEERMNLVIWLARLNVNYGTGGPFGAAIFDMEQKTLFIPGVNLVVLSHASIAHAEIVAITLAQQKLGSHDLSSVKGYRYELVTSTEPCAMCLGAIPWSGVRSLVCGARDEDARSVGFDEGAKVSDWVASLEKRGISVMRDVCRKNAVGVLVDYKRGGGKIYNPSPDQKMKR